MENTKISEQLLQLEMRASDLEDLLFQQYPFLSLNLIKYHPANVKSIINIYSSYIQKANFADGQISQMVIEYISLSDKIKSIIQINDVVTSGFENTIEKRFLVAQYIIQKARIEILKPGLAEYVLHKILSKDERGMLNTEQVEHRDFTGQVIYLEENLLKNSLGNFDPTATISNEKRNFAIRSNISMLSYHSDLHNYLLNNFKYSSNYQTFAIFNSTITDEACFIASRVLLERYCKSVYDLIQNRKADVKDAVFSVKKFLQNTAEDYLKDGKSNNDEIKIGSIYNYCFEYLNENKVQDSERISLELLRLCFESIREWAFFPNRFYNITFRLADSNEKIFPEVEYIMDLKEISSNPDQTIYSYAYAVAFPEIVREQIYSIATKGVTNPDSIEQTVSSLNGLGRVEKWKKRLGGYLQKENYIYLKEKYINDLV